MISLADINIFYIIDIKKNDPKPYGWIVMCFNKTFYLYYVNFTDIAEL